MTVTAEPTGVRLTNDDLRTLFLFEALTDDQLSWFAERGWVAEVPGGSTVFAEGEPAELMMVLLSGTIAMSRRACGGSRRWRSDLWQSPRRRPAWPERRRRWQGWPGWRRSGSSPSGRRRCSLASP